MTGIVTQALAERLPPAVDIVATDLNQAMIDFAGAKPGLARANQIAMGANCSLEWLATGCGYLYRQAEVVDREALLAARSLLAEQESLPPLSGGG